VNPDHLFVGTRAENMADMARKGRARAGAFKRLSPDQRSRVAELYAAGLSKRAIGRDIGIDPVTVRKIIQRVTA
jgi:DNA invertase Pin-like site-specific DNA recombinase